MGPPGRLHQLAELARTVFVYKKSSTGGGDRRADFTQPDGGQGRGPEMSKNLMEEFGPKRFFEQAQKNRPNLMLRRQ